MGGRKGLGEVPCHESTTGGRREQHALNLAGGCQSYSVKCDRRCAKPPSATTHGTSYPPVGS